MERPATNFVELGGMPLPPMILVQAGWQEYPHKKIEDAKEQITFFNSSDEWEIRKRLANPYELIYSSDEIFPSVAKTIPLSRSFFKMVEMLNLIDFWRDKKQIRSAHVCEGPGGFIQCLVEESKKRKINCSSVFAMTLKPTKSYIPGWKRSYNFLKLHPEIHLEYGADGTGDVLNPDNQKGFCKKVGLCDIFTADGGFDFSVDYNKQEQNAFQLLLASFIIGLQVLDEKGVLIIKLFDIYSPATQDLILGSASFFQSFTLYKPVTSRPCNSERYFIGKGFLKNKSVTQWIAHLQDAFDKYSTHRFTRFFINSWPKKLQDLLNEQITWQENLQIQSIYNTMNIDKSKIQAILERNVDLCKKWCIENNLEII